jgi:hypothetical protein
MAHTKGEWKAFIPKGSNGFWYVHASGKVEVATLYQSVPPAELEANAHLIAAAPDMLEALKEALSCYSVDGVHMRIPQSCLYKFEQAIRKAEGKGV